MGIFHYLNVREGNCSIIQHPSRRTSVIDVCNASNEAEDETLSAIRKATGEAIYKVTRRPGNFNQKQLPVNPIEYLQGLAADNVFRFILTHPDMDHMDGIEDFFEAFSPWNFWDTNNTCETEFEEGSPYNPDDWDFYKSIRDSNPTTAPRRLALYANARGHHYNQDEEGKGGGDGLYILAPTKELVAAANKIDDYNDCSYVILYRSEGGRVLLAGDSHDKTWEHILENHKADIKDVDLLIAPHHGRDSKRSYEFLDVVNPALTFFGNARSEHLAYGAWSSRGLPIVTNNEANCMVVDTNTNPLELYVSNKEFAESRNKYTYYSDVHKGYYVGTITR